MLLIKNYLYNLLYQVTILVLPLITVPYISRVLGSEGVGIVEYTSAIVMYFVVFAIFGLALYGTRTIAYYRDDLEQRNRVFWDLTYLKFVITFISVALYLILSLSFDSKYFMILLIQALNILSAGIEITWFFNGMEDLQKIAVRNIATRLTGTALIFILVKTPDDIWIYVMIFSLTGVISNLVLWQYLKDYKVGFKSISFSGIKTHFVACIGLFMSSMIAILYTYLDRTILGSIASDSEVGHYAMANKLLMMTIGIVSCLGTVMLPRISNVFAQGNLDLVKHYTSLSFNFMVMFSIYIAAGFLGASAEFVPWFLGNDFLPVTNLLNISSFTVILIVISNVFGMQLLIPMGREKEYNISLIIGIVSLVTFSVILVPHYKAIGTCISLVISSSITVLCRFYFLRNILPHKAMFQEVWKYIAGGIAITLSLQYIGSLMGVGILTTCVQIIIASLIYLGILSVTRASILDVIIEKVFKKIFDKHLKASHSEYQD